MKLKIEFDTEIENPNLIGEVLRNVFWDQGKNEIGCCSTFEYNEDVIEWPDEFEPYYGITWKCSNWCGIKCRYFWDGDGTIQFIFPDGSILENNDCKDYNWEWRRYIND